MTVSIIFYDIKTLNIYGDHAFMVLLLSPRPQFHGLQFQRFQVHWLAAVATFSVFVEF